MANVITRHYLGWRYGAVVPMFAGLVGKSAPFITREAQQVIKQRLALDVADHRTVLATFRLLARADVILPMEEKILLGIPDEFRDKAELFSTCFGTSGAVEAPMAKVFINIRNVFQLLETIIKENIEVVRHLKSKRKTL